MGVYLSQPITDKTVHQGSNAEFRYTSCEMQGWRKFMEDAKITQLDIQNNGKNYTIFGVFDGHGGTSAVIQELRFLPLWKQTSLMSSKRMRNF